jgi:DNA repair exonuclease SbcCD nuclease subunit
LPSSKKEKRHEGLPDTSFVNIRIVHTADNHIGLKFKSRQYPPGVRTSLVQERLDALSRVVSTANDRDAHFLVVAGDLFDSVHVPKNEIKGTADILRAFNGKHVVVLPGNHDFLEQSEDSLWGTFRRLMPEHLLLLLDRSEPFDIEVADRHVVFFPAPCTGKHSKTNAIGWVAPAKKDPAHLNIGVAHGSIQGVSPDLAESYYPMTEKELRDAGVSFWLTGHTHVRIPEEKRTEGAFYYVPSTHTPDGFDCAHEGSAWYIEVDPFGKAIAQAFTTGAIRFADYERTVNSAADIQLLSEALARQDLARTLVKIFLKGRLSEEDRRSLDTLVQSVRDRSLYCEIDLNAISLNVDLNTIDRTFPSGSLAHRLLTALADKPEDSLALQLAHELVKEARR